jgi:hypothetical protein
MPKAHSGGTPRKRVRTLNAMSPEAFLEVALEAFLEVDSRSSSHQHSVVSGATSTADLRLTSAGSSHNS